VIATALGVIERRRPDGTASLEAFALQLARIVAERGIIGLVIGVPLINGKPTAFSSYVVDFVKALSDTVVALPGARALSGLPTLFVDESFTSSEARTAITAASSKRSLQVKRKDSVAACLILQRFLD
jgi:RNase H-fold protein (predicted Holliday junction resolvase)